MADSIELLIKSVESILATRRLTKVEVAKAAGMSPQQLGDQLKGDRFPRINLVDRLSRALGVPVFYLLMTPDERALWDSVKAAKPALKDRLLASLDQMSEAELEEMDAAAQVIGRTKAVRSDQKKKSG